MVEIEYVDSFKKKVKKIKDEILKLRVKKQIDKIIEYPESGKPMMYGRKGTREVYISPYRLAYIYSKEENKITFVDLYHKDKQ